MGDYVNSMVFGLTPPLSSLTAAGKMVFVGDTHSDMIDFRPHKYEGGHHAQDLADFVEDILRPVVVPLTVRDDSFSS